MVSRPPIPAPPLDIPPPPELSADARATILALVREAVAAALEGRRVSPQPKELPAELMAEAGVFVTITRGGELRACIGRLDPSTPLASNLVEAARAAATADPRFDPIRRAELPSLQLEVSVLGPLTPLPDPAAFEPATMGIVVDRGGRRGLLLPQVARERGWDAEETLEAVCWKAGLPAAAWRDPATRLEVFGATILDEAAT